MSGAQEYDADLRRYIYIRFLAEGSPPVVERMPEDFRRDGEVIAHQLERLDAAQLV